MTTFGNTRDVLAAAKTRMEKAVEDFRKDLATIRTGRANAALLDHVRVDYHGTPMPVNQLGTLTVPDPSMIVISPWDPGAVPLIDKAIRSADLGLNPTNDGKVVRVPIPSLTEERRKDLVKQLHKVLENHRTAVRNVRRDLKEAIEKLEKEKKIRGRWTSWKGFLMRRRRKSRIYPRPKRKRSCRFNKNCGMAGFGFGGVALLGAAEFVFGEGVSTRSRVNSWVSSFWTARIKAL
jgi:ribosome recycling factor